MEGNRKSELYSQIPSEEAIQCMAHLKGIVQQVTSA